jgi:hypothetical protein
MLLISSMSLVFVANPTTKAISALAQAKLLADTCYACREGLTIENPEIFNIIVQLIGTQAVKFHDADNHTKYYIHIVKILSYLAELTTNNQGKLASVGKLTV